MLGFIEGKSQNMYTQFFNKLQNNRFTNFTALIKQTSESCLQNVKES